MRGSALEIITTTSASTCSFEAVSVLSIEVKELQSQQNHKKEKE